MKIMNLMNRWSLFSPIGLKVGTGFALCIGMAAIRNSPNITADMLWLLGGTLAATIIVAVVGGEDED